MGFDPRSQFAAMIVYLTVARKGLILNWFVIYGIHISDICINGESNLF